jgi:hypothetical protein
VWGPFLHPASRKASP